VVAINIADLLKDAVLGQFLLAPVCPNRIIVNAEPGKMDGAALLLECPLDRAEAIVDVIRLRYGAAKMRCYKRTKKWQLATFVTL